MINIAYACDDNYIEQTSVSLLSVLMNSVSEIKFNIIDMGISKISKKKLIDMCLSYENCEIRFVDKEDIFSGFSAQETVRHTNSVYAKIFFSKMKNVDKIIYLDSDTIVKSDIKEFWNIDMEGKVIAGVETICTKETREKLNLNENDIFINDGVVMIDLVKWRVKNYEEKCLKLILEYDYNPPVLSEGIINKVCRNDILKISPKFNLMSSFLFFKTKDINTLARKKIYSDTEMKNAIDNPVVVHYLSSFYNRPWNKSCNHPLKYDYLNMKKLTPWASNALGIVELPKRLKIIRQLYLYLPSGIFFKIKSILGGIG